MGLRFVVAIITTDFKSLLRYLVFRIEVVLPEYCLFTPTIEVYSLLCTSEKSLYFSPLPLPAIFCCFLLFTACQLDCLCRAGGKWNCL